MSTLLRLEDLRRHGYNDKHLVTVRDEVVPLHGLDYKTPTMTVGWKRETNRSVSYERDERC